MEERPLSGIHGGSSYEAMVAEFGRDTKTIDSRLQRVKRKILAHQRSREARRNPQGFSSARLSARSE